MFENRTHPLEGDFVNGIARQIEDAEKTAQKPPLSISILKIFESDTFRLISTIGTSPTAV
jgi:hypothetical protein